jgi:hypothetical protein
MGGENECGGGYPFHPSEIGRLLRHNKGITASDAKQVSHFDSDRPHRHPVERFGSPWNDKADKAATNQIDMPFKDRARGVERIFATD